jgi:microcystin-dependent protein
MTQAFIGEIKMFGGNFAPRNYAFCNGQLLPISQNTALFSLLGTTYGGNGQTTFALPNLQGNVPMGQGPGPGLSPRTLGETDGVPSVTLLESQLPPHSHTQQASTAAATATAGPSGAPAATTVPLYSAGSRDAPMAAAAVGAAGNSAPHNNMAPYLAVSFIICLFGVFPARN